MNTMVSRMKSLGISELGVSERLDLIGEIWDSVATHPGNVPVPEWQVEVLKRRLEVFESDGNHGRPVDDVIADIKKRL